GGVKGVAHVLGGEERAALQLHHARSGELIALSARDAWFAYPFWLEDRQAPDYARTVDIHRKPGYDPCELFFDPQLWWPKGRAIRKLIQKKLGFRTLFDVIPLNAGLVKGSHGLPMQSSADRPLLVADGEPPTEKELPMTAVRDRVLEALNLGE
ncbi:MAG: alkaline phosphatase family protein, partial [Candidatus Acidiferrum sp.]